MSEKKPQTLANHARFDPPMHFIILPVLALNVIYACIHAYQRPHFGSYWLILISVILVMLALKARIYALRVQDRVIRLEERLRLAALLPEPTGSRIAELTEQQLIALRFASDAEIPGLVQQTLAQNLTGPQIKKAIVQWRPDYWRV
jgi:hypothetical protein